VDEKGDAEEVTLMPMMLLRLSRALRLASVLVVAGRPEMGNLFASLVVFPRRMTVQKEKLFGWPSFFDRACSSSPASGE
jgi:hypothetical protein